MSLTPALWCVQSESRGAGGADGGDSGDPDAAPTLPTRPKAQLAAASRTMLNQFVDELRGEAKVDLSGKNLMDEGVAFVAEGLAYNQTCRSARFASNGVGPAACYQLAEVLKVRIPRPHSCRPPPRCASSAPRVRLRSQRSALLSPEMAMYWWLNVWCVSASPPVAGIRRRQSGGG